MTERDRRQNDAGAAQRPKLKKETLKDLAPDPGAVDVRGGAARAGGGGDGACTYKATGCTAATE